MNRLSIILPSKILSRRLVIREAFDTDQETVKKFYERDDREFLCRYYGWSDEDCDRSLSDVKGLITAIKAQYIKDYYIFEIGNPTQIVGQIGVIGDRMRSPQMSCFISKDARRNGYGLEAHRKLIEVTGKCNPRIKTLWVEVRPDNTASRNLLIQNGFKPTGIRKSSNFGLSAKSLCLRRAL